MAESRWRHRGQEWQDMRDGAMAALDALDDQERRPWRWEQLDAVLDAIEFYGFVVCRAVPVATNEPEKCQGTPSCRKLPQHAAGLHAVPTNEEQP